MKALIVEDDKILSDTIKQCIEKKYSVEQAYDGYEGYMFAKENIYDIIILDLMMPEMDGITTLKCLREKPQTSLIPVIIMSAKVQEAEIEEYKQQDILGVISKPFDPTQLVPQILELWNNYQNKK